MNLMKPSKYSTDKLAQIILIPICYIWCILFFVINILFYYDSCKQFIDNTLFIIIPIYSILGEIILFIPLILFFIFECKPQFQKILQYIYNSFLFIGFLFFLATSILSIYTFAFYLPNQKLRFEGIERQEYEMKNECCFPVYENGYLCDCPLIQKESFCISDDKDTYHQFNPEQQCCEGKLYYNCIEYTGIIIANISLCIINFVFSIWGFISTRSIRIHTKEININLIEGE